MFKSIQNMFKQTAIYSLGNLSSKLIGLILLPLFTEYLTTAEYGILAILEATSHIMIGVLALNLPLAMLRWSSAEDDSRKMKSIIFTTIVSLALIIFVQLIFLLQSTDFFSQLLFGNKNYSDYFFFLFLVVAFGVYNGIPLNIIRINEKPVYFIIANTLKFTVILLLNFYFLVYLKQGVVGIIKSQLIGEIVLFIVTIPIVVKNIHFKFDVQVFKEMLQYGIPLIFSTVSTFALSYADRYIIQYYLDSSRVGIYSLGYKIASVLNMLVLQSFQLGFLPIAYKKLGASDEKRFFSKILTYYTFILVFIALGLSLFSKELIQLLAQKPEYYAAYSVVPIISLAFVIKGIQYTYALSFHYAKKTIYVAAIIIITALINVGLNFLFIKEFGFMGAAFAMLISTFLMMILSYFFGKRIYRIPYENKKLIILIAAGIILFFIGDLTNEINIFIRLIFKMILIISLPFVLHLFNFYEEAELRRVKNAWHKWKKPSRWKENIKKIKL